MLYNFWLVDDNRNGDVSIEFKAPRFYEVEGRNIPARLLVGFELGEYHFEPGDVYTFVLTDITDSEDDYLGAEETTGTVAVGGSASGNLEVDNDVDWFRVRLEEGKSYRVSMRGAESGGGTLADPFLAIGTVKVIVDEYYGFDLSALRNDDKSTTEKDSELVVPVFTTHDAYIHAATSGAGTGTYTIEVEEVPSMQNQRANSPATGGPGITGTVQAGETLTATTDGIEDEDGLTGAVFSYQWVRSDADIEGAASSTYTVTGDDEGKPIQVRVTFTDDAGNAESLTSYAKLSAPPLIIPDEEPPPKSSATREAREAQGAQEAVETPLTAAIHDAPESHDGQEDFTFELRFSEEPKEGFSSLTLQDHAFTVTGGEVAGARRLDGDSATPNTRWEITVSPDSNANVTVELPATEDCDTQGAICAEDGTMLSSPLKFTVKGPPLTANTVSVPASPQRQRRIQIQDRLQRGVFAQLQDAAGRPCVHGGGRQGNRRAAAGQGQQHRLGDRRQTGLQRRRDDHSARHRGLRCAGGHLHRRRQDAVQPPGVHRQRAGPVAGLRLCSGSACAMPRQRTQYRRSTYVVPDDFPQRLKRFKEESGLSWSEISRRLGTYRHTVWRWWKAGVRPNQHHMKALLDLADDFGLGHLFTSRERRAVGGVAAVPETQKGPHTWLCAGGDHRWCCDGLPLCVAA